MITTTTTLTLLPLLLSVSVSAQQNVLTNGNSQLPSCAVQCPLLEQANSACAATGTPQAAWTCFCQSANSITAYLTNLYNTAVGVCDSVCTDATQNAQVSTWYKSNCGSDFGVSEHAQDVAGSGSGTTTTTTAAAAGGAATGAATGNTKGSSGSSSNTGSGTTSFMPGSGGNGGGGDWWSGHYQWIVMVIVMAIGFPLLAWAGVALKRRHDRKQDRSTGGFNTGITKRGDGAGYIGDDEKNVSRVDMAAVPMESSGRNSPARTREAFMPYGYGYAKSETRLGSSRGGERRPGSPLTQGETAENGGLGPWPAEREGRGLSRRG